MPRSRGGAAPARSAPTRPQAAPPARSSAPQQQQRPMSTAPAQQAPAQAPAQQSSGLFGQMASTAAGVAVGSSIGHAIGGFFGGGSSAAPAEQQPTQQPIDNYAPAGQYSAQQAGGQDIPDACSVDLKNFTSCMNQNRGSMDICGWYFEQLKACKRAASEY